MIGKIEITKLKEHPKNNYYFSELDGKKYEEIKRSIAENGIRNPIKCTTSFTVISGHQRLKIAKELGMETVPVQIIDVEGEDAEYLMIEENIHRTRTEKDPIKKSNVAIFLSKYYKIDWRKKERTHDSVRNQLLEYEQFCLLCGYDFAPVLEMHHVTPTKLGGENDIGNVCMLCPTCHSVVERAQSKKSLNEYGWEYISNWIVDNYDKSEIEKLNFLWKKAGYTKSIELK